MMMRSTHNSSKHEDPTLKLKRKINDLDKLNYQLNNQIKAASKLYRILNRKKLAQINRISAETTHFLVTVRGHLSNKESEPNSQKVLSYDGGIGGVVSKTNHLFEQAKIMECRLQGKLSSIHES